ncbi:ABC1 kinase family protein [Marinobacterium jannaschii]|uniref:ABC1 kinase family protein n=1 Tax=Marinobacterium jannaschii TaxID=64970 RepID=UPI000564F2FC|nr:AarF/ABC1/UbiB kinase family protein [Marinobacterium jannaschii]
MTKEIPVPKNRASRLLKIGRLLGGIAGQMLSDGVSALADGKPLRASDLLLTPANAMRLAERLSEMRGAAMKIGQLLSMETGDYLPPALTEILATLREHAHPMPQHQVAQVLETAWGKGWDGAFQQFSFTPFATASIGQVHEACKDGRHLAIKVQYPGIRKSIDSDVDNVAALFGLFRLIPGEFDLAPLLKEAKQQLHQEADYRAEAVNIAEYNRFIGDDSGFELPTVDSSLTTSDVLSMSFVAGAPIESLASSPLNVRNRVATQLLALVLKELFEWGLVQTDAQFGNYRYQVERDRIGLLDFGATRHYSDELVDAFRRLMGAAIKGDLSAIEHTAVELGYLRQAESLAYRRGLCEMIRAVAEPVRYPGLFDFGTSDLSKRVVDLAISLRLHQRYMHLPPTDMLFLHRKIGGTYLLCARLRAQVDVNRLAAPYIR